MKQEGRGQGTTFKRMTEPCCCCCCQVTSVMSNSVRPQRWQASPSLGFSRQEHWSGLLVPSPVQGLRLIRSKARRRGSRSRGWHVEPLPAGVTGLVGPAVSLCLGRLEASALPDSTGRLRVTGRLPAAKQASGLLLPLLTDGGGAPPGDRGHSARGDTAQGQAGHKPRLPHLPGGGLWGKSRFPCL